MFFFLSGDPVVIRYDGQGEGNTPVFEVSTSNGLVPQDGISMTCSVGQDGILQYFPTPSSTQCGGIPSNPDVLLASCAPVSVEPPLNM